MSGWAAHKERLRKRREAESFVAESAVPEPIEWLGGSAGFAQREALYNARRSAISDEVMDRGCREASRGPTERERRLLYSIENKIMPGFTADDLLDMPGSDRAGQYLCEPLFFEWRFPGPCRKCGVVAPRQPGSKLCANCFRWILDPEKREAAEVRRRARNKRKRAEAIATIPQSKEWRRAARTLRRAMRFLNENTPETWEVDHIVAIMNEGSRGRGYNHPANERPYPKLLNGRKSNLETEKVLGFAELDSDSIDPPISKLWEFYANIREAFRTGGVSTADYREWWAEKRRNREPGFFPVLLIENDPALYEDQGNG